MKKVFLTPKSSINNLKRICFFGLIFLLINQEAFSQFYERDKIVGSSRGSYDYLGDEKSVAIWGDYSAAGTSRSGINGASAGAVYVYQRSSTTCQWDEIHTFTSTSTNPSANFDNDNFGVSVAMNDNFLVIGATGNDFDANHANYLSAAGAIFIYERIGSTWSFLAKVVPNNTDRVSGALFGHDVDIVDNFIIVGAYGENNNQGAAYIFEYNGSNWIQQNRLTASDGDSNDEFGYSVAISPDWAAVGAPNDENGMLTIPSQATVTGAGSAYVFINNGSWVQNDKVTANTRDQYDWFGYDLDIDGSSLIVSEFNDDDNLAGVTNPDALLNNGPGIFSQSCCAYGSVHYFNLTGNNWIWNSKIQPSNIRIGDWFGSSLALDGNLLVAGAYRTYRLIQNSTLNQVIEAGAVYVFELSSGSWNQIDRMTHSDRGPGPINGPGVQDYFGKSVAINQNRIIASAAREDEDDAVIPSNYITHAGSAYIFEAGIEADLPIITASQTSFCNGTNTAITLTIDPSNSLNDALEWEWTTNPASTPFSSGPLYQVQVNTSTTTTYYVRGVGCGVPDGPWGQITVTGSIVNSWHQFTKNSAGGDIIKDVITDDDGNVFIAGSFQGETTLNGGNNPDIAMIHPQNNGSAFVAKYNMCGDLLWADYSIDGNHSTSNSIVLDQNNGILYSTGNANLYSTIAVRYNSTGALILNAVNGFTSFVAAHDMTTGNALYVEKLQPTIPYTTGQFETSANAITINENNGDIYVGGYYYVSGNSQLNAYVQKYSPSSGSIGTLVAEIQGYGDGTSEVHDLDYYEGTTPGQLAIIGDYGNDVHFDWKYYSNGTSGGGSALYNYNLQGFFLLYEDFGNGFNSIHESSSNGGGTSTGKGVSFDGSTGKCFLTGDYVKNMINPYNFSANSLQISTSPDKATYLIGYDVSNNTGWAHDIQSISGRSEGVSVVARNGRVYFTGSFIDHISLSTGQILPYTGSLNSRTYVISLDDNGSAIWQNATTDYGIAAHQPRSIAVDNNNHVFIGGSFWGNMGYMNTSGSPQITSTGAGSNGFLLRADQSSGQLRKANKQLVKDDEDILILDESNALNIKVYPNPSTDGKFNIVLNQPINGTLEITNINGKHIHKQMINNDNSFINIDLSNIKAGVYFITISNDHNTITRKLFLTSNQ